ncbi:MAG: hypothetical protein M1531_07430, partial [Chloroflexi bacterium]|nr:hypothetical protein [Chloroflexota bacterium]
LFVSSAPLVLDVCRDRPGPESIETYGVFGATVLAGMDDLSATCRSRSIRFVMERNSRPVRRSLDGGMLAELRDRLYAFRCRHMYTTLADAPRFVRDGRLDDVLVPLHQMVRLAQPGFETDFVAFGRGLEHQRNEEEAVGLDAEVVRVAEACRDKVVGGKFLVGSVAEKLNATRPEREKLGERTVGDLLTCLGFDPTRSSTGYAACLCDGARLERLKRRYSVGDAPNDVDGTEQSDEAERLRAPNKTVL